MERASAKWTAIYGLISILYLVWVILKLNKRNCHFTSHLWLRPSVRTFVFHNFIIYITKQRYPHGMFFFLFFINLFIYTDNKTSVNGYGFPYIKFNYYFIISRVHNVKPNRQCHFIIILSSWQEGEFLCTSIHGMVLFVTSLPS